VSSPFDDLRGAENELWNAAFGDEYFEVMQDPNAQALFHEAFFHRDAWDSEQLGAIRDTLREYLYDTYDIDFDAVFDWEAWREAYG
jgi:hypothetical protein